MRIKILGSGPLEAEFKKIKQEKPCNVEFVGYTPYRKMAAYLVKSDITINSFVRKAPQSIVTKIGDYLAAGKPMINTCSSLEFKEKVENDRFGINVIAEDVDELAKAVMFLYNNTTLRSEMGKAARTIAEKQFDRKQAYLVIKDMVNKLLL